MAYEDGGKPELTGWRYWLWWLWATDEGFACPGRVPAVRRPQRPREKAPAAQLAAASSRTYH
jgi:hypothetical protein